MSATEKIYDVTLRGFIGGTKFVDGIRANSMDEAVSKALDTIPAKDRWQWKEHHTARKSPVTGNGDG